MKRAMIVLAASAILLSLGGTAAAQSACRFEGSLETLRAQIPAQVGACVAEQTTDSCTGDTIQRTSGGMLVLRKSDGSAAFTDGFQTWVMGPCGLQTRLNTQRFPWELNPGVSAVCAAAPVAAPITDAAPCVSTPGASAPTAPSTAVGQVAAPTNLDPAMGAGTNFMLNKDIVNTPDANGNNVWSMQCTNASAVKLTWQWSGALAADQVFDVQVKKFNDPDWSGVAWVRDETAAGQYEFDGLVYSGSGAHSWRVAVARVDVAAPKVLSYVSPWSVEGEFTIYCP